AREPEALPAREAARRVPAVQVAPAPAPARAQVVAAQVPQPPMPPAQARPTPSQPTEAASDPVAPAVVDTREPSPMVLRWASANRYSPEMIAVLTRADDRVRHGFQLANRGALFSAKSEFITALQIIAEANDTQQGTRMYTKALSAGLAALKEASVFV